MPSWLPSIIVAVIGLVGTIGVAYLAHRQWNITRRDSKKQAFFAKRKEIYEQLWNMTEQIDVDLRTQPEALQYVQQKITDVNAFILKNEVYLADDDHALIDSCIQALVAAAKWSAGHPDPEVQENYHKTNIVALPPQLAATFEPRIKLRKRIRRVLEGS